MQVNRNKSHRNQVNNAFKNSKKQGNTFSFTYSSVSAKKY